MRYWIIILIIINLLTCKKVLNVNDFREDFTSYQPELRIEALMLPADSTAIIRIDRSTRLDEGLNHEGMYNCIDDDFDWNYYFCAEGDSSFQSKAECESYCTIYNTDCLIHLYLCDRDSLTFISEVNCLEHCESINGECLTDDVGEDGLKAEDKDGNGIIENTGPFGDIVADTGEGDGVPGCNEPNVDEFDEILPNIHVDETHCSVYVIHQTDTCNFEFDEKGGQFFEDPQPLKNINDSKTVFYGAWRPKLDLCPNNFFTHYDTEYNFVCECTNDDDFASYGKIKATDTLRRPVVIYNENELENIKDCALLEGSETIYDCMTTYETDTLYFIEMEAMSYVSQLEDSITNLGFNIESLFSHKINYASLAISNKYQAVQYIYNDKGEWIYYHGHEAKVTNQDNIINNNICLWSENVVAEQYQFLIDEDYIIESSLFKYDIYTFSKGYENYYFYDMLGLSDPVRTNLRDQNGNTVMGAFGAMARNSIYFIVISMDDILDLIMQ